MEDVIRLARVSAEEVKEKGEECDSGGCGRADERGAPLEVGL